MFNMPPTIKEKIKKRADTPQRKCTLFFMANFFVVRQPSAHSSDLYFGFFRYPPTISSFV